MNRLALLTSQPHRLMFFFGALQAAVAFGWWSADVVARYLPGVALHAWTVPPMWAPALSIALASGEIARIGLAPIHLLAIGYFAAMTLGMASRVSLAPRPCGERAEASGSRWRPHER